MSEEEKKVKKISVRAIAMGFHNGVRRRPGDVFFVEEGIKGKWFEPVDATVAAKVKAADEEAALAKKKAEDDAKAAKIKADQDAADAKKKADQDAKDKKAEADAKAKAAKASASAKASETKPKGKGSDAPDGDEGDLA